ncbi:hypothetical protein SNE40_010827 [Patella caerulea]|uniref:Uncharacterized protein n=1 Tax=Patella caerulea TaxID=87958 RepID=A0AAN8JV66_PATCE
MIIKKLHFFGKTTTEEATSRPTKRSPSRRGRSLAYYLPLSGGRQNIRVCQVFYLTTLDINHKHIYYKIS